MVWNISYLTALSPLVMLLIGLTFTVLHDPYIDRAHRRIMLVIIVLSAALIAQNAIEDYLSAGAPRQMLRTAIAVFGYTIRPIFLILFLYIVRPDRKHIAAWCLAGANLAIYSTAFFSQLSFWISENNHFRAGPLANACMVISMVLLAALLFQTIHRYRSKTIGSLFLPCMVVLMILAAVAMDGEVGSTSQPVTFLTVAIIVSTVFYYIWLHLQFVREHEEDLVTRQRIQLMLSQIKPHFLYNALGSIEALCERDPKAAKMATRKFSKYLRGNMDSLSGESMIPFEKELQHTQLYLELEQIRFGDALQVEYNIEARDFFLPPLTLEPIVENAVKHGIRMKADGRGTVAVSAAEYEDRYELRVTDDGAGFDPEAVSADEAHVGIRNVRERLQRICGGTLTIRSAVGEGTTAVICLPKEKGPV